MSCAKEIPSEFEGMKPYYMNRNDLRIVAQLPPQTIENAGKILWHNQYLFLVDLNKGIHVIDMRDTLQPQKISFLRIPGNKDVTSQNNRLYCDNGPDLLVFDISQINNIVLIERIQNVFQPSEFTPPDYNGYFECANYTNEQWLIGWRKEMITNPKCRK